MPATAAITKAGMAVRRGPLLAATLAALSSGLGARAISAQHLALTGATILNPADESTRHGVLLIEDGRVSRIAETVPPDFPGETLDLTGKFVMPALADLHSHTFGNGSPAGMPHYLGPQGTANAALYTGVGFVLDLFSAEEMILSFRDRQRDEGGQGAALLAAGKPDCRPGPHCAPPRHMRRGFWTSGGVSSPATRRRFWSSTRRRSRPSPTRSGCTR